MGHSSKSPSSNVLQVVGQAAGHLQTSVQLLLVGLGQSLDLYEEVGAAVAKMRVPEVVQGPISVAGVAPRRGRPRPGPDRAAGRTHRQLVEPVQVELADDAAEVLGFEELLLPGGAEPHAQQLLLEEPLVDEQAFAAGVPAHRMDARAVNQQPQLHGEGAGPGDDRAGARPEGGGGGAETSRQRRLRHRAGRQLSRHAAARAQHPAAHNGRRARAVPPRLSARTRPTHDARSGRPRGDPQPREPRPRSAPRCPQQPRALRALPFPQRPPSPDPTALRVTERIQLSSTVISVLESRRYLISALGARGEAGRTTPPNTRQRCFPEFSSPLLKYAKLYTLSLGMRTQFGEQSQEGLWWLFGEWPPPYFILSWPQVHLRT